MNFASKQACSAAGAYAALGTHAFPYTPMFSVYLSIVTWIYFLCEYDSMREARTSPSKHIGVVSPRVSII